MFMLIVAWILFVSLLILTFVSIQDARDKGLDLAHGAFLFAVLSAAIIVGVPLMRGLF